MLVFTLSERLGGRYEVLRAPIVETLGHLLMQRKENEAKQEKEDVERWIQYLMLIHSKPLSKDDPPEKKKGREEFVDSIRPKLKNVSLAPAPKFDWDMSQMERLKAMQGGE